MSSNFDVVNLRGQSLIAVGLSSIFGLTTIPGQEWVMIKYVSGGTLEIGGVSLTWGQGYKFSTSEVLTLDFRGKPYFAASGATVVMDVLRGLSSGNL